MLERLFPSQIDNSYRGHPIALWIFVPIVLSKLFMGVNCAGLNPWITSRWVLQHADAIPIDRFSTDSAQVVLFMFSAWGLGLLIMSLLGVVVLIRYRAMIPLMFLLLTLEQVGRRMLAAMIPIARAHDGAGVSPGVLINWGFSGLLVIGLALSLAGPRAAR